MKKNILAFVFFTNLAFAQQKDSVYKNAVAFQFLDNTPMLGVSYKRIVKQNTKTFLEAQIGYGVGYSNFFDSNFASKNHNLTTGLSVVFNKRIRPVIGLGLMRQNYVYDYDLAADKVQWLPTGWAGVRIDKAHQRFYMQMGLSSVYIRDSKMTLLNATDLVYRHTYSLMFFPGGGLGLKF